MGKSRRTEKIETFNTWYSQDIQAYKRFAENRELICSTEEQLPEQFPDCKELLDTYTDSLHIEAQLECEADFKRGFRLGAALAFDLIQEIE